MHEKSVRKRIINYDIVRALAILLVVLCHTTETLYPLTSSSYNLASGPSKILMVSLLILGRLGVPFFLFLTGALILKKQINTDSDVLNFYKKNLIPLIVVNIIWVLIYNAYFLISGQTEKTSLDLVIKEIFLIEQVPLANMWYIPMIIGMYLGLPFIAKIVKTFSRKTIFILISLIFVTSFIIPFLDTIFRIFGSTEDFFSLLNLSFFGGAYGVYILIGYYMTNKKPKIRTLWLYMIAIISFLITCFTIILSKSDYSQFTYNLWYNFPFLLICAASIFIIIDRVNYAKLSKKTTSFITFISKASLAIFFMHIIVQNYLKPYILLVPVATPIKLLILFSVNTIICVVLCFILSKSKFIARRVLLIKG